MKIAAVKGALARYHDKFIKISGYDMGLIIDTLEAAKAYRDKVDYTGGDSTQYFAEEQAAFDMAYAALEVYAAEVFTDTKYAPTGAYGRQWDTNDAGTHESGCKCRVCMSKTWLLLILAGHTPYYDALTATPGTDAGTNQCKPTVMFVANRLKLQNIWCVFWRKCLETRKTQTLTPRHYIQKLSVI